LRAGSGRNWFRPDPARKLSANLYDICRIRTELVPSWSCSQVVSKPVWHMQDQDGTGSVLVLLASCQETCMTYAGSGRNWFLPEPARKLSGNLYDICRIRTELVPSWSCSQVVSKLVWHLPLLCVRWKTPDDGQRNCPKHVDFYSENKFQKLVHLVGFIIRISGNNEEF